jgi:hypothetical protein
MSLNIEIEHTQVQIFTWFTANKLVVNKDKTQSIIFSLREIGENSKTIKLLGIHLDTKMTWEAHADHLVKTISKKLFVLRQLRSEVNDKTLVTAYHALVHSNITYAILFTYVKFLTSRGDVFVFWVDLVTEMTVETYLKHLGPVYRSEIKLIVIKCEINWTRDQIEPIEVPDSWVNRALKFNSN